MGLSYEAIRNGLRVDSIPSHGLQVYRMLPRANTERMVEDKLVKAENVTTFVDPACELIERISHAPAIFQSYSFQISSYEPFDSSSIVARDDCYRSWDCCFFQGVGLVTRPRVSAEGGRVVQRQNHREDPG